MVCTICRREFEKRRYMEPFHEVCGSECFKEKLWQEREKEYLAGTPFIIINGSMYFDGGYKNTDRLDRLGHGGHEFKIRMNDGREIVTNNLWHNGEVPENHREVLRDNAVFIK